MAYSTLPEPKDFKRVDDIMAKAPGSISGQERLAKDMAKKITKADKAFRRYKAADDRGHQHLADIFMDRYNELTGMVKKSPSAIKPSVAKPLPPAPQAKSMVAIDSAQEKKLRMASDTIINSQRSASAEDLRALRGIEKRFYQTGHLTKDDMITLRDMFDEYK